MLLRENRMLMGLLRDCRRVLGLALAAFIVVSTGVEAAVATDPLPSWNEGVAKKAIVDFVGRVTSEGSTGFVPEPERIALFDNDGTLWCEQPFYVQLAFAIDRVKALAPQHRDWASKPPFKAILNHDFKSLMASGEKGILQILEVTHAGMTTDEFSGIVADWLETSRHPRFKRPYTELVYQPMLELLAYLRMNGFKTYIVSGGGIEFMRVFAGRIYGVPPEQVIGSSGVTRYQVGADGKPVLIKQAKVEFVDDGPGKPVGINLFIGQRPIFAFGNSDGDLQMLQWTAAGKGPSFMGLVHHDDGVREYAYDKGSPIGRLNHALDAAKTQGWTVVSMQKD